ncbi:hypothetical protein [Sorangium sp. So ce1153]|uniref:hypothetical protein n=1 Tax=Sorangium sp. So ce1153 TaxID=3133333 RepID=UPI003F6218A9
MTESAHKGRSIENVSAVLGVRFDEPSVAWIIDLLCMDRLLRFMPIGLVYLNCSHDSTDYDEARYSVVETTTERRVMSSEERHRYQYVEYGDSDRSFWIVSIHGSGMVITVVCDEFSLESLNLAEYYPQVA